VRYKQNQIFAQALLSLKIEYSRLRLHLVRDIFMSNFRLQTCFVLLQLMAKYIMSAHVIFQYFFFFLEVMKTGFCHSNM
jgi:hypothetical protein